MDTLEFQRLIRANEEYSKRFYNNIYFNKAIMALLANKEYGGDISVKDVLDILCKMVDLLLPETYR